MGKGKSGCKISKIIAQKDSELSMLRQEAEFKDASWRGRSYQQGLDVGYNPSKIKITQDYVEWMYRQYLERAHK
jgi:hypothetical protein